MRWGFVERTESRSHSRTRQRGAAETAIAVRGALVCLVVRLSCFRPARCFARSRGHSLGRSVSAPARSTAVYPLEVTRLKGTNFTHTRSYIEADFGLEGWATVSAGLSPVSRATIDSVIAVGWYPAALHVELLHASRHGARREAWAPRAASRGVRRGIRLHADPSDPLSGREPGILARTRRRDLDALLRLRPLVRRPPHPDDHPGDALRLRRRRPLYCSCLGAYFVRLFELNRRRARRGSWRIRCAARAGTQCAATTGRGAKSRRVLFDHARTPDFAGPAGFSLETSSFEAPRMPSASRAPHDTKEGCARGWSTVHFSPLALTHRGGRLLPEHGRDSRVEDLRRFRDRRGAPNEDVLPLGTLGCHDPREALRDVNVEPAFPPTARSFFNANQRL